MKLASRWSAVEVRVGAWFCSCLMPNCHSDTIVYVQIIGDSDLPLAYSAAATQHNAIVVGYCRTALAAVAGVAAGILGLTGIVGFLFYLMSSLVLSLLLLSKTGLEWQKYFLSGYTLFAGLIFSETTTYILCWTFIYGMVHVY